MNTGIKIVAIGASVVVGAEVARLTSGLWGPRLRKATDTTVTNLRTFGWTTFYVVKAVVTGRDPYGIVEGATPQGFVRHMDKSLEVNLPLAQRQRAASLN